MVEQLALNQFVVGSIPTALTMENSTVLLDTDEYSIMIVEIGWRRNG